MYKYFRNVIKLWSVHFFLYFWQKNKHSQCIDLLHDTHLVHQVPVHNQAHNFCHFMCNLISLIPVSWTVKKQLNENQPHLNCVKNTQIHLEVSGLHWAAGYLKKGWAWVVSSQKWIILVIKGQYEYYVVFNCP